MPDPSSSRRLIHRSDSKKANQKQINAQDAPHSFVISSYTPLAEKLDESENSPQAEQGTPGFPSLSLSGIVAWGVGIGVGALAGGVGWKFWLGTEVHRWCAECKTVTVDGHSFLHCPTQLSAWSLAISALLLALTLIVTPLVFLSYSSHSPLSLSTSTIPRLQVVAVGPLLTITSFALSILLSFLPPSRATFPLLFLCPLLGMALERHFAKKVGPNYVSSAAGYPLILTGALGLVAKGVGVGVGGVLMNERGEGVEMVDFPGLSIPGVHLRQVYLFLAVTPIAIRIISAAFFLVTTSGWDSWILALFDKLSLGRHAINTKCYIALQVTEMAFGFALLTMTTALLFSSSLSPEAEKNTRFSHFFVSLLYGAFAAQVAGLLATSYSLFFAIFCARDSRRLRGSGVRDGYHRLQEGKSLGSFPENSVDERCVDGTEGVSADRAGFFSRYTFWWVTPVLKIANRKKKLNPSNLPELPSYDNPSKLFKNLKNITQKRKLEGKAPLSGVAFMYTLFFAIQPRAFIECIFNGYLFLGCMFLDPILLHKLLLTAQQSSNLLTSLGLVIALFISLLFRVSCVEYCYFTSCRIMTNARSASVQAIYEATFTMPLPCAVEYDQGKLTNLVATDADEFAKFEWVIFFLAQWSWSVIALPASLYMVYTLVGNAAFIGVGTMIVVTLGNVFLARYTKTFWRAVKQSRDQRAQLMQGLLSTMKAVKLQMCERLWFDRISKARNKELGYIKRSRYLSAMNQMMGTFGEIAVPISIFAWYTLYDKRALDATTAFTTLAWITQLSWSIKCLPWILWVYATISPSAKRLSTFLHKASPSASPSEPKNGLDSENVLGFEKKKNHSRKMSSWDSKTFTLDSEQTFNSVSTNPAVQVLLGDMGYELAEDTRIVFRHLNLTISKGSLTLIAGRVGSGKSTLLNSLCKAQPLLSGNVHIDGPRAYVGQRAFLLNATIRDNIIFGKPYEKKRFEDVISRCALEPDLEITKQRDLTKVGERGVQVSGGQRTRIALARALYSDADVYFFDDPLSALDAHCGSIVWERVIVYLISMKKTVIIATHQVQFFHRKEVSRIIFLTSDKKSSLSSMTFDGPLDRMPVDIRESLQISEISDQETNENNSVDVESDGDVDNKENIFSRNNTSREDDGKRKTGRKRGKRSVRETKRIQDDNSGQLGETESLVTLKECEAHITKLLSLHQGRMVTNRLISLLTRSLRDEGENADDSKGFEDEEHTDETDETREVGNISWTDFYFYLSEFGNAASTSLLVIVCILTVAFSALLNVWLSVWAENQNQGEQAKQSLLVYGVIGGLKALAVAMSTIILAINSQRASVRIHGKMLKSLLGTTMEFFDKTPAGRIQNRFLQDLQSVDVELPWLLRWQMSKTFELMGMLVIVFVFAPYSLIAIPMLGPIYYLIFTRVRIAARDTRRMESIAHSPCYAHFGDTIKGKPCILAYGDESRFKYISLGLVKNMARKKYSNNAVVKWSGALTIQAGSVLYLICGIVCVVLASRGDISVAKMGLVLLYAAQTQRGIMDYLSGMTRLETQFVSVERTAEYTRLYNDDELLTLESKHSKGVGIKQMQGKGGSDVNITNVRMRYKLHKPHVLNGLTLFIAKGEKWAICGRSGCGKSTVFAALSRLYPIASGSVLMDGQNIHDMPLRELRGTIQVVDQDAILVSGTLRENIVGPGLQDSNNKAHDSKVWESVRKAGIEDMVQNLENQLDFEVKDRGENLSAGERQLVVLARALMGVNRIRVLLCDEATANVDLKSDEKVHDVLLSLRTTVIMICHRLQHMHRFDKVAVLGNGKVLESGSPKDLLADPRSELSALYRHAKMKADHQ